MSYDEFWSHYLQAHRDPRTRGMHYVGTLAALLALALGLGRDWRYVIAAPIAGYAFAWIGHFGFERNKPATFGHPIWSLWSDFRMLGLFLSGQLGGELRRQGITGEKRA
ncbi:MAG TPA: DUF962 domain-containing protein [Stellaceae bacterium]|nr:DUF962 domain-containing protein [Stellaceae bacterium]